MSGSINGGRRKRRGMLTLALSSGIALTLPAGAAHAQNDALGQMDRQVAAVTAAVKLSVVSILAGQSDLLRRPNETAARAAASRVHQPAISRLRIGTGFVLDRSGTILTTADVVGDTHDVTVKLWDGRALTGKVLGSDPLTGVAVVKVKSGDLPALRIVGTDRPEPGQWAIVVGNQLDKAQRVWVGTVARTDALLARRPGQTISVTAGDTGAIETLARGLLPPAPTGRLLQIDAPVGPGASGAPVLNSRGEVIGVVVATSSSPPPAADPGPPGEVSSRVQEKLRENREWQRQVEAIAAEAQRIGQQAAQHARGLSEQIATKAKKVADEATQRSMSLRQRFEKEDQQIEQDHSLSESERQRRKAEQARQLQQEMQPLMSDLQRQLDQELKPLEEELKRQLKSDLMPLQEELKKLNETLPMVQGMREISIDLEPQIAAAVAQAHAAARAALAAAVQAGEAMPDPPAAPPAPPAAPPDPPSAPPAAAAPPGPGAPPAMPDPPASRPAPRLPAGTAAPAPAAAPDPAPAAAGAVAAADPTLPPKVLFWSGRTPTPGASTFAIPAATAAWAATQIRDFGGVSHPYLGLQLLELRPEERERLNAPAEARVRVGNVLPRSPAQEAGFQKNDLILELQGKRVQGLAGLTDRIRRSRVGKRLAVVIWRDGRRMTLHPVPKEQAFGTWLFYGPSGNVSPRALFVSPGQGYTRMPLPGARTLIRPRDWNGTLLPRPLQPDAHILRISPPGTVSASARGASVTLDAQEAELGAVARELSRATGLTIMAEGDAARQPVTIRVQDVSVDDLVESLARLYHLRSERHGDTITFRQH